MKKGVLRLIAMALSLCLLLSGCILPGLSGSSLDDMVYVRPNLPELTNAANQCATLAQEDPTPEELWAEAADFFALYSDFYTQYLLAYVRYCQDTTDLYWVDEYNYCEQRIAQAEAARDNLLHELAKCPLREELEAEEYFGENFFDDYDGESIWTEDFQKLNEQEAQLISDYYRICQEGSGYTPYTTEYFENCGIHLEELFVDLIALRQQLAQAAGYDSYPEYAYEQMYHRDYSVADAANLCQQISEELTPLYRDLAESDFWEMGIYESGETDTFRYLRTLANNMGGKVKRAFEQMSQNDLYDIAARPNKYDSTFEVYFYDYGMPFIFLSPTGTEMDHLSFAHEFGHFCNDQVSYGSVAGLDTAEVFSQGMEYLSLFYSTPSPELELQKLADSLCVYVEQAAYSSFEQQIYALPSGELTVEQLRTVYETTCQTYGLDCWELDSRSYVTVSHFFTDPLYVISYVVSNDAAFQLYQLEQQDEGAGLAIYMEHLDTEQQDFLPFLEETGLDSPFLDGRIQKVKDTLKDALLKTS